MISDICGYIKNLRLCSSTSRIAMKLAPADSDQLNIPLVGEEFTYMIFVSPSLLDPTIRFTKTLKFYLLYAVLKLGAQQSSPVSATSKICLPITLESGKWTDPGAVITTSSDQPYRF